MKKLNIAGVKIHCVDFSKTILKIEDFIRLKKPHQVITINPEFVVTAQKDKEFKNILNSADLALPDGIGVVLASKLLKGCVKERITGIDLIPEIVKLAQKKGFSIYFLGAEEDIAKKTVDILLKQYPKLKIAGAEAGSPHDLDLVERIKRTKPDILFVAFGHPKQEKWIYKYKERLSIPVSIGVGGAFDFISKKVPRAPLWIQKMGLEWLYRLIKEPKRWKRQLKLIMFIFLIFGQFIRSLD